MAKQKKGKKAVKATRKKARDKEAVKSAEKETTVHKPTVDNDKTKTKAKPKTKPKLKSKPRSRPKPEIVTSSDIEHLSKSIEGTQDDKPAGNSKEVDVGKSDTGIPTEKVEDSHKDDQAGEITEEILEAAAETERLAEETESLQIDDDQTSVLVEVEEPDEADDLSQDKSAEDVSESVVEDSVTAEISTENRDDTGTEGQPEEVNESLIEDYDTVESRNEEADGFQTDSKAGDAIEAAVETERLTEETEGLQIDDDQASVLVEVEKPDEAEDLSQDKSAEDVSESVVEDSVTAEISTENRDDTGTENQPEEVNEVLIEDSDTLESRIEKTDDIQSDNQAGEAIEVAANAEETDIGNSIADGQTVVDRIKKFSSGIFRVGSKTDDSIEEGIESPETDTNHTGEVDYTQVDSRVAGDDVVASDDKILAAVYSDKKTYRTKKTGVIISVFIVIAALILLIVASIERRSAKKALVQISKVAESVKQMQEEILKDRKQVARSQIESRELVIDALSLTRNGLELERANSDEVEVKRIIGVFINDIDERITKIKGDIALLRNKFKKTD